MNRRTTAAALLSALATTSLSAHDFWIEPSSFRPPAPAQIRVALRVGQDFRGDPVPRDDRKIVRFVAVGPSGETPIAGLPGTDPAGFARLDRPGLYVVGYRSGRSPIELEAEKFEKYLADEGLEEASKARARRGESDRPGKEVYSRCAKALILAGEGPTAGFDRPLGFTLELVPRALPKIGELPVELLYEGRPLSGALVVAMNQQDAQEKLKARTDRKGRVVLKLPRAGTWLVKAVHMIPAPADAGADWESLWASLTFEIASP